MLKQPEFAHAFRLWDTQWQKIREHFTEEEKAALNAAVVGQSICPKGAMLNLNALTEDLRAKLSSALIAAKPASKS